MKKTVICSIGIFLFLAMAGPSFAATSSSTVEFLKKLNGYYYCLSREGLKNYHCDVTLSTDAPSGGADAAFWKAVEGMRFTVDDSTADVTSVQGFPAPGTGDAQLDGRAGKLEQILLETLKTFFQSWKSFVMEPLNDPADMEKNDLKFKKEESGFKVIELDPSGGMFVGSFDKKGKMIEFLMQDGGSKTIVQPGFTNSPKGYLLTSMLFKGADIDQQFKVGYGVVDRYWLPKDLSIRVNLVDSGAGNVEFDFHFSNYRVNQ